MRSSKGRTRNKNNRNKSLGNVINRNFESSGPDGKVRGTPQQVIDKYQQAARDAQLNNDNVAAENFLQHAEHYVRLLAEAQRELDARREQQERDNRERQQERDRERTEQQNSAADMPDISGSIDVIDNAEQGTAQDDHGLVETPEHAAEPEPKAEDKEAKPRKPRKPRAKKPAASDEAAPVMAQEPDTSSDAA